ncbi:MAG: TonB-dependent receptor [FCB group bacterium]|nr:TonB-dependent receptor [FCB group bacterium]
MSHVTGEEKQIEHFSWHAHLIDAHGHPVPYANVVVNELNRGTVSDENGHVQLDHLPRGDFEVNITVIGYVMESIHIFIPQPADEVAEITMEHTILEGSVVTVSVTGMATDILHSERTVSVLEGEDLQRQSGQSLSATVGSVPGVQLLSQGHAVAKPVIRGMSNQRIVILKDGVKMEGQQWGGHHTPEADVLSIGRIEVVKGPMGLIYGSEALGGVIQLQSPDLTTLDEGGKPLTLAARTGFHANSQQFQGGFGIQKAWHNSALRINTSGRISDDYAAPGNSEFLKRISGTAFNQLSANLQFVKKFTGHEVEVLGSHYEEEQTLIGEGHWHNTGGGADGTEPWYHVLGEIVSPTTHQNLTLRGKVLMEHSWVEYDAGVQKNHRQGGAAGDEPAVDITMDTYTADVRWRHVVQDKLPGTIGMSYMNKTSTSIGNERLLPDYTMDALGIFSYYRWKINPFTFSGGLRVDANTYDIQTSSFPMASITEDVSKEYFPVTSASVGLIWHRMETPYSLAMNVGTGWRPANPYELYINGVHHGDWKIEVGDPDLQEETAVNTDLILRHIAGSHIGELTFFYNRMRSYIYSSPTGTVDAATKIPIYWITKGDAHTYGSELRLEYSLGTHLSADFGWDLMWGALLDDVSDADGDGTIEDALPSMNPPRILSGIRYEVDRLPMFSKVTFEINGEYVFAQENLAEMENLIDDGYGGATFLEPEAYPLLDVALHAGLNLWGISTDMTLGVDNVLNTQYYSHLSRYKGLVYDQGFNLYGEVRLKF